MTLLTIAEAAEEARFSPGFIKKEIREGRLIARKYGRGTRIWREEFEAWIKRGPKIVVSASDLDESPTEHTAIYVAEKPMGDRR